MDSLQHIQGINDRTGLDTAVFHVLGIEYNRSASSKGDESANISGGEEEMEGIGILCLRVFWLYMFCREYFPYQSYVKDDAGI